MRDQAPPKPRHARSIRRRQAVKAALVLGVVWLGVIVVTSISRANRVTPESLQAEARSQPLEKLNEQDREDAIITLAQQINQLPLVQRLDPAVQATMFEQFGQMTPQEQQTFIERAMPQGIEQMAEAFNRMPDEQRQRMVQRLTDAWHDAPLPPDNLTPEAMEAMIQESVDAFFENTDTQAKLDLLPLMLRLQQALRKR